MCPSALFVRFRFPRAILSARIARAEFFSPRVGSACHTPKGDVTLRTPGTVSVHGRTRGQLGWPQPYPPAQHHRSRDDWPLPVTESFQPFLVRSHSQLGSTWELSRARPDGAPYQHQQPTVSISQRRLLTPRPTPGHDSPLGPGSPSSTLGPTSADPQATLDAFRHRWLLGTEPLLPRHRPRHRTRFRADSYDRPRPFSSGFA